jgi:solute carrier family 35 protein E2
MNKLHTSPSTLATFQMISTAVLGCAKIYLARCCAPAELPRSAREKSSLLPGPQGPALSDDERLAAIPTRTFYRDMMIVGSLRFVTVVAGLLSLKFVAVSFTETIKSSAPFFTVIFSWALLRERTSLMVNLSLVPVVLGLALCSVTELSFNMIGFYAAVFNNCMDCVQNVFSKKLLTTQYTYVQLQFYTSAAALVVQLPFVLLSSGLASASGLRLGDERDAAVDAAERAGEWSWELLLHLLLNGVSFHLQSVAAYAVMSVVSPVTASVINTLKRAMLIWLSVLWFGNPVTFWSAAGTLIVVVGVFAYNYARQVRPAAGAVRPARAPQSVRALRPCCLERELTSCAPFLFLREPYLRLRSPTPLASLRRITRPA